MNAAVKLAVNALSSASSDRDPEDIRAKTNANGGAVAIGLPVSATGATGGRLVMTMAYELQRRGGGYGLCTICGGVGESEAFIIKV